MTKRVTPCVPQAPPVGRGFVVWMVVLCVSAVPIAGAAAAAGKTETSDGCRDGTAVPEETKPAESVPARSSTKTGTDKPVVSSGH